MPGVATYNTAVHLLASWVNFSCTRERQHLLVGLEFQLNPTTGTSSASERDLGVESEKTRWSRAEFSVSSGGNRRNGEGEKATVSTVVQDASLPQTGHLYQKRPHIRTHYSSRSTQRCCSCSPALAYSSISHQQQLEQVVVGFRLPRRHRLRGPAALRSTCTSVHSKCKTLLSELPSLLLMLLSLSLFLRREEIVGSFFCRSLLSCLPNYGDSRTGSRISHCRVPPPRLRCTLSCRCVALFEQLQV